MRITWESLAHKPKMQLSSAEVKMGLFTMAVIDLDAPNPPRLHLLSVNASERLPSGNMAADYMPPQPPEGQWHRYRVLVLRQRGVVSVPSILSRSAFQADTLEGSVIAKFECQSNGKILRNCKSLSV